MDGKRSQSAPSGTLPVQHHVLHRRMAEVLALREKVTSLEKVGKETRRRATKASDPHFHRVQTETGAMMSHIKQDDPDGRSAIRRSPGAHQSVSERPVKSAANDNDNQGPWPFVPFPEGSYPSVLSEEVATPQRLSWKAKLILLAYAAVTPIAMLGWLYLLWLAIVSSVVWMLT